MNFKTFVELIKESYTEWGNDKASRLAAAFSYYTLFSMAPLLIVIIAIAGLFFGASAAQGQIAGELEKTFGHEASQALQAMVAAAGSRPKSGIFATVVGIATLLMGAAGLFGQLQDALNTVWEVAPKPGLGFMEMLRQRFLSFAMVLGTGFIMLISLVLSAGLSAFATFMQSRMPIPEFVLQAVVMVLSLGLTMLLFAMIYKVLPDVEIQWRDVWIGAAITAFLLTIGRILLGLYLGKSGVTSAYGAAGSLVLILLWINYSAQILLFGAEFTQVYANRFGSHLKPSPHAVAVTEEGRAQQGMADVDAIAGTAPNGRSTEVWTPGVAAASGVPGNRKNAGSKPGVEKADVDYLSAMMLGFAAVLFLASRRGNHDAR